MKFNPDVREMTSKTVFTGVSLNSMVIGFRYAAVSTESLAIRALPSSISRSRARARSWLGLAARILRKLARAASASCRFQAAAASAYRRP